MHDNPVGVATNSPPLDWHLTNLRNYVNQTAIDVPPLTVDGVTVAPLGEGSGMLGLPGDFTPPSRFVRAAAFAAAAWKPETAAGGVNTVLHILSSFDIVKGVVRDATPAGISAQDLEGLGDYTCFSSVSELNASPAFTVRTYDDPIPRRVALEDVELTSGPVRSFALTPGPPAFVRF